MSCRDVASNVSTERIRGGTHQGPELPLAAIPILVSSPEYFIREHCLSLFPDLESALSMK